MQANVSLEDDEKKPAARSIKRNDKVDLEDLVSSQSVGLVVNGMAYNVNKQPWTPVLTIALCQNFLCFIINLPTFFTGEDENWKGGVDCCNACLYLKYKIDNIFHNKHAITSYLKEQYGSFLQKILLLP